MSKPGQDHYSYTAYADPAMARSFDDRRFGGPIGAMVASTQARVLANFIGRLPGKSIIDVGTGTGRAALLLARGGADVTGIDASEEMLAVARKRARAELLQVPFIQGDAHHVDFPDQSFDVAVSLRVLMHTPEWRTCVAELCRLSRLLVVVDFPALDSFAILEALGRRVKYALGSKTEPYRVLRFRDVETEFAKHGFRVRSVHRQFVLPIGFYKLFGSIGFTRWLEGLFLDLGLIKIFGSPVTILAEKWQS